jgi:heavy metal efflux system protein
MLSKIINFSIKNKLIIGLLTVFLIGFGVYELRHLPIDAVPDITDNQTQIITVAPSLSASDVERLITFPIEQANTNIPGIKQVRSFSRFGLSIVTIIFEEKTDIYWARQQIAERLMQVQNELPTDIDAPFLAPVTTGLGEIYQYVLKPEKGYEHEFSATELRTLQDWVVRRQLLSVKGVADVSSFGGFKKQYEVAIDVNRLTAHGVTIQEVYEALSKNNQNTGGAYIEKGSNSFFIRSEGLVKSIKDIESIVVKRSENLIPLRIVDVANVRMGSAIRYGAMTYNGEREVAGAVVMMLKGANSNEVITNIKSRIESIQESLPKGVIIEPFLDRTKMVNNAISTVSKNLIEGALIVIFVLVLFLGNLRAGFIVASVIPLSLLFAIIMMNVFGVSGNLMSLGALDFGLIVDGAVIIVEAILHNLQSNKQHAYTKVEMDEEVNKSASKMMNSAVFGQIIILVVYLPIFTLQGIEGKMFKPMAQTVAFALIGAFLLSLTYVPMMSSIFLNRKKIQKESLSDRVMGALERGYKNVLTKSFNHATKIIVAAVSLFALAVVLLTQIGGEFIPSLPEGDFAVETRVLTGSNINKSIDAVSQSSKILLKEFPEVVKVVGKTGSSEIPTDPMPIEASDLIVVLKDRKEWTSAKSYDELEQKMQRALEDVPGVQFSFQFPVSMRFNELISGAKQDVVLKLFGENLDSLDYYAKKIGKICASISGTTGIYVEPIAGMPQIVIYYNRSLLTQYGLTIDEVNESVNSAFAGKIAGTVYEGERKFDLVVRLQDEKRKELTDVQQLLIATPNGQTIPLSVVATVALEDNPNQIQREDAQRRIIVGFNLLDRDVQSVVAELKGKIAQQIQLPVGYSIAYGGSFQNLEAAKARLGLAVPLSLLLIFILLYFAFKSIKQSVLIFTAIPLSATGGVFALFLRDMPFSISAGIGFIALFGVAVLNGIILLAELNRLQKTQIMDLKELIITGASSRLRPILMTASVASLGFLPMALSHGEGAEVQRPLATVVIGGLLFATFLSLFLLPILYSLTTKKLPKTAALTIVILLLSVPAYSQTSLSFHQASELALKQNKGLQNAYLRMEAKQKMIKTGATIPFTDVSSSFGQMNSAYSDFGVAVQQTFDFPSVYVQQKKLLTEEWKGSALTAKKEELELNYRVALTYFELSYWSEKERLLYQTDSLVNGYLQKLRLKYDTGSIGLLEKNAAEIYYSQIVAQLQLVKQAKENAQMQLSVLLNDATMYVPSDNRATLNVALMTLDSTVIANHPLLQSMQQNRRIVQGNIQVEKSKVLPQIHAGYNVMSMKGMGANDISYDGRLRFHSFNVGIGIPLFYGASKAKIDALKVEQEVVQGEYEYTKQQLLGQLKVLKQNYERQLTIVEKFESESLKRSIEIQEVAGQQFEAGKINYLEWSFLMNQSISIQNEYIEQVKKINELVIELNTIAVN